MKIGPFSELFDLPVETIRYYVNEGLLTPHQKNSRYDFRDADCADLQWIIKLKSFYFTIKDIHKIISLKRLSNLDSPEELKDYISILNRQKVFLKEEKKKITEALKLLDEDVYAVSALKNSKCERKSAISFKFLEYIACPSCSDSLTLENCSIENKEILSGVLKCKCGYEAIIQNGIIIGQTGDLSRYDGADAQRNCYRMMSPELISMLQKAYFDMSERLKLIETDGKVILEDFINNYCFSYYNFATLNPKAFYIISDQYLEVVQVYKSLIDKLNLPLNVLYIAASSHQLPIKEKCVDIYIDFDSSNEYAIFNKGYSIHAVQRFLNDSSYILGAFFHFKMNSASLGELHRQYPMSWEHCFDWNFFQKYLADSGYSPAYKNNIGQVTNSGYGESFSYHVNHDVLLLDTYQFKHL